MLSHRIFVLTVLVNPLVPKKGMHNLLVAQNCSKHLVVLLISESPCLLITPFHVLSSVPTCGLKSPNRTIDSADVTLCDDNDDDNILFMLSNIIKYMQCTMKHEKETRHNNEC